MKVNSLYRNYQFNRFNEDSSKINKANQDGEKFKKSYNQYSSDKKHGNYNEANDFFEDIPLNISRNWHSFMVSRIPIGISNEDWQDLLQHSKYLLHEVTMDYKTKHDIRELSQRDYFKVCELAKIIWDEEEMQK